MPKNSKQRKVVQALLAWYTRQGRTLPWRGIANPYRILISEIMLQQTHVHRVLVTYPEFLRRFPTLRALARATQRDVVMAWQGMGYNNRAVRLHKLALTVTAHHGGKIPGDFDSLIALPGIGRYTANALLSSAFSKRCAIVDVNVERVLSRIFWRMHATDRMRSAKEIWAMAETILPTARTYDWNQALMDLGATVCTAKSPRCTVCPVARYCASRTRMNGITSHSSRREKGKDEIPNRIYRGKIVQHLRDANGKRSIRADRLAKILQTNISTSNERWLKTLLAGLERDGLIRVQGNGSLHSTKVSLA